jgi:hypothetical protein
MMSKEDRWLSKRTSLRVLVTFRASHRYCRFHRAVGAAPNLKMHNHDWKERLLEGTQRREERMKQAAMRVTLNNHKHGFHIDDDHQRDIRMVNYYFLHERTKKDRGNKLSKKELRKHTRSQCHVKTV